MTTEAPFNPKWWREWRFIGALLALTGWLVWAYCRLRPRGRLVAFPRRLPGYHHWAYRRLAYSDIVALYHTHHLYLHLLPYVQNRIEYPVLLGIFMWLTSFAPGIDAYYTVNAVAIWLAAAASLVLLRKMVPRVYYWFAWTPLLLVYGMLNWDIVGIFLLVLGWHLYQRSRYNWAAVVFALAVSFKFFPIFVLPFILVELYRDRKILTLKTMVAVFSVVTLVLNVPFAYLNFKNWSFFFVFNAGRGVGADIWANHWVHAMPVAVVDVLSFLVVSAAVFWLGNQVYRGGSVISAAANLFAIFLVVNKVFSPQYMIWMMAYAVLAEWPAASYAWLALGGVVDYLNSLTVLFLIHTHSPSLRWYGDRLFPLGLLTRYGSIVAAAILNIRAKKAAPAHQGGSVNRTINVVG